MHLTMTRLIMKETYTSAMPCGHIVPVCMLCRGCEEAMETVVTVTMYNGQLSCSCTNAVRVL